MGKQKETRSSVAAPERAGLEAETGQAATSNSHFTTKDISRQRISRFLGHGAENGVTLKELAALTGIDTRAIRQMIRQERMAGVAIISDNKSGYYLTDDPAEAQRFARSMRRRAREISKAARAVEEAMGLG